MLRVSETFYSIQGEGPTTGYPSIFLRLQDCNFMCGGAGGYLLNKGKAKWWCDTEVVWRKGKPYENNELLEFWKTNNWLKKENELPHLVITGGEPLLQQDDIVDFIQFCKKSGYDFYVEIETNGSILPSDKFMQLLNQINCSPKLSNSGMIKQMRIQENVMKSYSQNNKVVFKFVLVDNEDYKEMMEEFIKPFNIPKYRVWLMPGAIDRQELEKNLPVLAEICKENGFKLATRLQIEVWNRTVGV
jgi:organic radical activating enzyme